MCLCICVNSNSDEAENDYSNEEVSDVSESLLPKLVAEAEALECAPETMAKVETKSDEPYNVESCNYRARKCSLKEYIWIVLWCTLWEELLKLHMVPEVFEVECYDTENYDTKEEHVLGSPRLSFTFASASITLNTTTSAEVTCSEDECVNDVYEEASCKNWNHHSYKRKCHEIATCLEKSLC